MRFLNGHPMEGHLAFFIYYRVNLWDRAGVILERMTEDRSLFPGIGPFYVTIAVVYLILCLFFFVQALKVSSQGKR